MVADPTIPLDGPARVLVTYASRMGSTAEIGEAIAERLRAADLDVTVVPVGQAPEQFRGRAARPSWVALILAGFRVDVPMLSGGSPATWHGGVHGIVFLLIIATGVLAPLTMDLAMRGDAGWRPITVMSLAASALFVVFLFFPWGNASFLVAIVTVFAWITAVAVRLATYTC